MELRLTYSTGFLDGMTVLIGIIGECDNEPCRNAMVEKLSAYREDVIAQRTQLLVSAFIDSPESVLDHE